jgi:tRNA U34 5-methylaminomethyl-2-thiouridine-forming methyltransferase MnmC
MPGFVNYKKGCTRLAAACDKVYQLLSHCRWFSPASSTTKTGRHDIAEILLKVALNTKKINQSIKDTKKHKPSDHRSYLYG